MTTSSTPADPSAQAAPAWSVGDVLDYTWTDPRGPQTRTGRVFQVVEAGVIVEWLDLAGPIPLTDPGLAHADPSAATS